ncbi:MAG: DUF285 domain-containing protein [Candidatus Saccharibacteria bacterium]|nr:DUF285 domain-containing protein [Candidatus Saccharibacteria bacterium]
MKKGYAKLLLPIVTMVVIFAGIAAHALSSRKDAYIEFSISQMLSISISSSDVSIDNLLPGTADNSNEINVLVSTNSESGYTVNAVAGSLESNTSDLIRIDEEGDGRQDVFSSIEPGIIVSEITQDRTWGFSTDHGETYNGIPNFTSLVPVLIKTTTDPANDEIPFLIGARANQFQAPGEYRNTVTFTAIANPIPDTIATTRYMQDINDDVYASMEMEEQYQLIDKRDNKKYWVAKLQDGNVWMTQNLNFELTAPSVTLYPDTSNTVSPVTINVASQRVDEIEKSGTTWNGSNGVVYPSNIDPDTYVEGGSYASNGIFRLKESLKSTEDLDADSENWHYIIGGRYPTRSASLMAAVCPKGWRLPDRNTSGDSVDEQYSLDKLVENYNIMGAAPIYISALPYESNISVNESGSTYNSAKYITLNGTMELSAGPDNIIYGISSLSDGYIYANAFASIRCVALRTSVYPFVYYMNNGTNDIYYQYEPASWGGADASIRARAMGTDVMPPLDTVGFLGWATDPNASEPEYQPGDTLITNTSTANNFYAIWGSVEHSFEEAFEAAGKEKVDGEHYAMQDMTGSICAAVSVNASIDLMDTRDGKIYKVAKFKRYSEGSSATCWMIEGLRLGDGATELTLTPNDTNTTTDFVLPAISDPIESTTTAQYYVDNETTDSSQRLVGNSYNYYAASVGTNSPKHSSICPKGWQMPGGRSYDDYGYYSYRELNDSYSNYYRYRTFTIYDNNWTDAVYKNTSTSSSNYGKSYAESSGGSTYQLPTTSFQHVRCVVKPGSASGNTIASAKAILGENDNLNFVYDTNEYVVGDTYTDNIGETIISRVYDVPLLASESNQPEWTTDYAGSTINISESFHDYEPISTAYWFANRSSAITGLANINMSKVINASHMFYYYTYTEYISGYSDSRWINGTAYVRRWTLDLSSWDMSNVVDMSYMFYHTGTETSDNLVWSLDLSSWNIDKAVNMAYMFAYTGNNYYYYPARSWDLNISGWDTSRVSSMAGMFEEAGSTSYYSYYSTVWTIEGLENLNVGRVTNMSNMFNKFMTRATNWSMDLSGWNMSNVVAMKSMFESAGLNSTTWSLDLNGWNLTNMRDMSGSESYMFNQAGNNATTWTLILDNWNIENIINMRNLFANTGPNATTYTLSLVGWSPDSIEDMSGNSSYLFNGAGDNATAWTLNMSEWDINNPIKIGSIFSNTGRNAVTWSPNVSNWDIIGAADLESMFAGSGSGNSGNNTVWSVDLSTWNAVGVTSMASMFAGSGASAKTYRINLRNLNSSNNTSLYNLFGGAVYNATVWEHDFHGMDTSSVTNMSGLFGGAGSKVQSWELDLSSWDVSKVESLYFYGGGFSNANPFTLDVHGWNLESLTTISSLFSGTNSSNTGTFYIDMSGWNTSNVTTVGSIVGGAGSSATNWTIDFTGWDLRKATSITNVFGGGGSNATNWKVIVDGWLLKDSGVSMNNLFSGAAGGSGVQKFEIVGLDSWDVSGVVSMKSMFAGSGGYANTYNIGDISGWDVSNVADFESMFGSVSMYKTNVDFSISGWTIAEGASMKSMFSAMCLNSDTCTISLPNWNINGAVTSSIFSGTGNSAREFTLNLPSWRGLNDSNRGVMPYVDSSKVESYTCNLSNWDVSNITSSIGFSGYGAKINITLDISGWNTSNFTGSIAFSGFGYNATGTVRVIGLGGLNIGNISSLSGAFASFGMNAAAVDLGNLSGWDTKNVVSMAGMFNGTGAAADAFNVGDLSGWDTSKVENMSGMFAGAGYEATTWYIGDISGWDVSKVTDHDNFIVSNTHGTNNIVEPSWN